MFTLPAGKRYATAMLFIAAAAALASTPLSASSTGIRATVQARAIIRIISGATVRLGEGALIGEAPKPQLTIAHADGGVKPANLIEFQ